MEFTNEEIRSLLYYQGAVENIVLKPNELYLKEFYKVDNAYEVINMLLFADIESEKIRLYTEKRDINSVILDYMPELLNVYCNLYSAICKYTYQNDNRGDVYTYRDDRNYTYIHMKEHMQNESFISSSLNPEKKENGFQNKEKLTFFEFEAGKDVEYLEMNEVLGELSGYPEEEEILFPPFLKVRLENKQMTEAEQQLKGINYTKPIGKYCVIFEKSTIVSKKMTEQMEKELEKVRNKILDPEAIKNAKEVWKEVKKNEIDAAKVEYYIKWKKCLQSYILKCYETIKWSVLNDVNRKNYFLNSIRNRVNIANCKRIRYERRLYIFYCLEIIVGVLAGLFLSFSLINYKAEENKILSLCMLAIFGIVAGICKVMSLSEKLMQRTEVFLRYDELLEHWNYEKLQDSKMLDSYINRMLEISFMDNQNCKTYTSKMISEMDIWEKKVEKMKES